VTVARFGIPEGWSVQAFCFALDPSAEQAACLRRQFGGRRYARNWAVRTLKSDLDRYRETGEQTAAPSLAGLRKRWNRVKDTECVDRDTGQVWWPHVSKEAFADGIKGAVDGYWNWQASRAGKRAGKRAGFPRFAKKAATGTGSPSPPEPSGSNRTAATSPSPGSAPSGCTRTPAGCSAC
jgi:putative transposase